eukprot:6375559-Prymnesium_polylepis.1
MGALIFGVSFVLIPLFSSSDVETVPDNATVSTCLTDVGSGTLSANTAAGASLLNSYRCGVGAAEET